MDVILASIATEEVNLLPFILPNQVSKLDHNDKFICSYLHPLLVKGSSGLIVDPKKRSLRGEVYGNEQPQRILAGR
jgi:hypothetical protein